MNMNRPYRSLVAVRLCGRIEMFGVFFHKIPLSQLEFGIQFQIILNGDSSTYLQVLWPNTTLQAYQIKTHFRVPKWNLMTKIF